MNRKKVRMFAAGRGRRFFCPHDCAIETWLLLQKELLSAIRWATRDSMSDDFYVLPDFLCDILPDWETAKKMAD